MLRFSIEVVMTNGTMIWIPMLTVGQAEKINTILSGKYKSHEMYVTTDKKRMPATREELLKAVDRISPEVIKTEEDMDE